MTAALGETEFQGAVRKKWQMAPGQILPYWATRLVAEDAGFQGKRIGQEPNSATHMTEDRQQPGPAV